MTQSSASESPVPHSADFAAGALKAPPASLNLEGQDVRRTPSGRRGASESACWPLVLLGPAGVRLAADRSALDGAASGLDGRPPWPARKCPNQVLTSYAGTFLGIAGMGSRQVRDACPVGCPDKISQNRVQIGSLPGCVSRCAMRVRHPARRLISADRTPQRSGCPNHTAPRVKRSSSTQNKNSGRQATQGYQWPAAGRRAVSVNSGQNS